MARYACFAFYLGTFDDIIKVSASVKIYSYSFAIIGMFICVIMSVGIYTVAVSRGDQMSSDDEKLIGISSLFGDRIGNPAGVLFPPWFGAVPMNSSTGHSDPIVGNTAGISAGAAIGAVIGSLAPLLIGSAALIIGPTVGSIVGGVLGQRFAAARLNKPSPETNPPPT